MSVQRLLNDIKFRQFKLFKHKEIGYLQFEYILSDRLALN